ncbi:MAG: PLP-dependent transferase, partial [Candidatus Thorarchaeota archaeon]
MKRERASATRCVQGNKIQTKGPAVEPIYQTSTFVFENQQEMLAAVRGESSQDVYTRWSNPTTSNVAHKMNALEGTETTLVLASGMAAISSAIFGLVKNGDNVIACESIYGGTLHLFEDILPQNGISVDFVEIDSFADAVMDSGRKYS